MKYRQSKVAYIARYVLYRWFVAMITVGYLAVYDYYKYKRNTLSLNNKSIMLEFGVFTQNSREIAYKNIQSVNVNQSVIGQIFNYGHVAITTANNSDSIKFEYVDEPQMLKQAIQDKI